jgi:hypothetical protein
MFLLAASALVALTNVMAAVSFLRVGSLRRAATPRPAEWPSLSIVVAACNEGDTLAAAARTLLAQEYPALEVVIVNDRSTDHTARVLDALAEQDARIHPVHVSHLPPRWLGKVHALARGVEQARGDWILFTDADVHLAPDTLMRAVATCLDRGLDHLTLFPRLERMSFLANMAVCAFGQMFMLFSRAAEVGKPGSSAFVGVGAFNLFRQAMLAKSEGLEWIRMEIADDAGLALLLQRAGARSLGLVAAADVGLQWYPTWRSMLCGVEKNFFAVGAQYLPAVTALWALVLPFFLAGPYVGLFCAHPTVHIVSLVALITLLPLSVAARVRMRLPLAPALLLHVGTLLLLWALLRSTWVVMRQGGVVWRGTHYPLRELRALQRVKLLPGSGSS